MSPSSQEANICVAPREFLSIHGATSQAAYMFQHHSSDNGVPPALIGSVGWSGIPAESGWTLEFSSALMIRSA
ncbi:hypothetical protein VTK73DRAFT_3210 [Phialemonium thermophilum]|uniref:Uncharacterized protein n=1 Tax=Phialemonium thermophilum TaxID=223376 RepID=A0ABR3VJN8_9PEZI